MNNYYVPDPALGSEYSHAKDIHKLMFMREENSLTNKAKTVIVISALRK